MPPSPSRTEDKLETRLRFSDRAPCYSLRLYDEASNNLPINNWVAHAQLQTAHMRKGVFGT